MNKPIYFILILILSSQLNAMQFPTPDNPQDIVAQYEQSNEEVRRGDRSPATPEKFIREESLEDLLRIGQERASRRLPLIITDETPGPIKNASQSPLDTRAPMGQQGGIGRGRQLPIVRKNKQIKPQDKFMTQIRAASAPKKEKDAPQK